MWSHSDLESLNESINWKSQWEYKSQKQSKVVCDYGIKTKVVLWIAMRKLVIWSKPNILFHWAHTRPKKLRLKTCPRAVCIIQWRLRRTCRFLRGSSFGFYVRISFVRSFRYCISRGGGRKVRWAASVDRHGGGRWLAKALREGNCEKPQMTACVAASNEKYGRANARCLEVH